jgi:hypothetical protein
LTTDAWTLQEIEVDFENRQVVQEGGGERFVKAPEVLVTLTYKVEGDNVESALEEWLKPRILSSIQWAGKWYRVEFLS